MEKKPFRSYLKCIRCGSLTNLLKEKKFRCRCGGLFDVVHVHDQNKTFGEYAALFDARARGSNFRADLPTMNSGVWRFKEWIMPDLGYEHVVTLGEGNHPIVRAGKHLRDWVGLEDLWLILEGVNPTGSFKDNGGTVMISVARAAGIKAIGCASTGDTSAMAAAYASAAGMQCLVILPEGKVTAAQLAQPLVHGAKVITLPGSFDDCMRAVQELVEGQLLFPANSLNPSRIEGHQATVFLTAQYFGWKLPDWFIVPVGNGSNCSSIGKAMRLMHGLGYGGPRARILGCQSEAAKPLGCSWTKTHRAGRVTAQDWNRNYAPLPVGETTATAARIGDPVSREKVIREITSSEGAMVVAPESLLNEAVSVCGKDGHFVCPQTGIALAGLRLAIKNGTVSREERAVAVSTATGLKFTDSAAEGLLKEIIKAPDCRTGTVAAIMKL